MTPDPKKLRDAAAALERAANAMVHASAWPHTRGTPCPVQREAAVREIQCAETLIAAAQ